MTTRNTSPGIAIHLCKMCLAACLAAAGLGCGVQGFPGPLGPVVQGGVPAGIYLGDATYEYKLDINGTPQKEWTETKPYSETVDDKGVPLIQPEGVPPRVNYVSSLELGGIQFTATIVSVSAIDNRVVIAYNATMIYEGIHIDGTGSWTYDYVSPSTLLFTDRYTAYSDVINGKMLGCSMVGTATLQK